MFYYFTTLLYNFKNHILFFHRIHKILKFIDYLHGCSNTNKTFIILKFVASVIFINWFGKADINSNPAKGPAKTSPVFFKKSSFINEKSNGSSSKLKSISFSSTCFFYGSNFDFWVLIYP